MHRVLRWAAVGGCVLFLFSGMSWAVSPEKVTGANGCPALTHVPVATALRGVPAEITAHVACETGSVDAVTIYVRLTDAGKPTPITMTGKGGGVYQALIPVSMIEGVTRFWYYIDAQGQAMPDQDRAGVAQTRWHVVTIIEHAEMEEGGAGSSRALYWTVGGLGAAAGAYFIVDHNRGDGDGEAAANSSPSQSPTSSSHKPTKKTRAGKEEPGTNAPSCILTGSETVTVAPSSGCDSTPVEIRICNTCPDAAISATASWGAINFNDHYAGAGCAPTAPPALMLPRPSDDPLGINPGDYSIKVWVNDQLIATVPWPDAHYPDCF